MAGTSHDRLARIRYGTVEQIRNLATCGNVVLGSEDESRCLDRPEAADGGWVERALRARVRERPPRVVGRDASELSARRGVLDRGSEEWCGHPGIHSGLSPPLRGSGHNGFQIRKERLGGWRQVS